MPIKKKGEQTPSTTTPLAIPFAGIPETHFRLLDQLEAVLQLYTSTSPKRDYSKSGRPLIFPEKKPVLCSASPRRRDLLALSGRDFSCQSPDEQIEEGLKDAADNFFSRTRGSWRDGGQYAMFLAAGKARSVYARNPKEAGIWIGADTLILFKEKILGKPKDRDEAAAMLCTLSGNSHLVITGVALLAHGFEVSRKPQGSRRPVPEGAATPRSGSGEESRNSLEGRADKNPPSKRPYLLEQTFFAVSRVSCRPLDANQRAYIKAYVASGSPLDKAGAYGIQDSGALLIEGIEGDYSNIVGLPIATLVRRLDALD